MNTLIMRAMPALVPLYSAPKRYYHNLDHINFCIGQMEWAKHQPEFDDLDQNDWNVIETAIWFHDVVYNPHAQQVNPGYSESESARFFHLFAKEFGHFDSAQDQKFVEAVTSLIYKTAHHVVTLPDWSATKLVGLMLDIDLSPLGLPWDQFLHNTEDVCAEYEMCDTREEMLRIAQGNAGFLERLAKRERIFYTNAFRDQFESYARKNINQRIAQVRQMVSHYEP